MGQEGSFLYYLGYLIVFCVILFLAWLTTRFVGSKASGDVRTKRMKVVETLPLGMDRSLLLVRVGEKHYLLAAGRGRTDFMSEVDPGAPVPETERPADFRAILERYSGLGERVVRPTSPGEEAESDSETNPMRNGIRRLRKINGNGRE